MQAQSDKCLNKGQAKLALLNCFFRIKNGGFFKMYLYRLLWIEIYTLIDLINV